MPHVLRRHLDLIALALLGGVLVAVPAIDLVAAGLFYDPAQGFWLRQQPLVRFVYELTPWITRAVVAGLLLFLLGAVSVGRAHAWWRAHRRHALYLLLVMIVGPGLLVNGVFKEHWGRARPSQVVEFGGDKTFTRAAIPADQCAKNCSFVSGHASVGFFFLALAFTDPRRRARWLVLGTGLGLGIGLVRMLQGGHFLSDVVFAGVVVYLTARGLHALLLRAPLESRA
jgi:lipid A 4'-phosphatase